MAALLRARASRSAWLPALLLLFLTGHLALMASPLHLVAAHAAGGDASHLGLAVPGHEQHALQPSTPDHEGSGDCGLEPAPPSGLTVRLLADSALAGRVWLRGADAAWFDLFARAFKPPGTADAQALLQVFRL